MVGVKGSSKLSVSKGGTFWLFPPGLRDDLSQYRSSHSGVDREATSRLPQLLGPTGCLFNY